VADLDAALPLFTGPLGMKSVGLDDSDSGRVAHLQSGPWNLRLIQPSSEGMLGWLGNRNGRFLSLVINASNVASVPDLQPRTDDLVDGYELPPEKNLGLRLQFPARQAQAATHISRD